MIALVGPPSVQDVPAVVYTPLFTIGAVLGLVGWILLIVMGFKEKVRWGLLVLLGPLAIDLIAGTHLWLGYLLGVAVVLPFVLLYLNQPKVSAGFIMYALGGLMMIPTLEVMIKWGTEQEKARTALEQKRSAPPAVQPAARTYIPSEPVQASAVAPLEKRTPKAPPTQPPEFVVPEIVQVMVVNATKTYYPLDCTAALPEGAYRISKSMAVRQGYKLAPPCAK